MWASVRLCRTSASSVVVFGTKSPQNLLQEAYPDGTRAHSFKVTKRLQNNSIQRAEKPLSPQQSSV